MHLSGEVLKRVREEILLLSQAEAAEQVGITRSTLQRWERGESSPQPYHRRNLYRVYGRGFRVLKVKSPFEDELETPETYDETIQEHKTNPTPEPSPSNTLVVSPISILESTTVTPSTTFSLVIADSFGERDESRDFIANNMTVHLWDLAYTSHLTYREKQDAIQQAIKDFDTMNAENKNYQINRREALSALATLPAITLRIKPGVEVVAQPSHYGTILEHCSASLEACWQLHKSGAISDSLLAFQCVSKYLPVLETIAKTSSLFQKEALDLAAQCAIIKTFLGWQCVSPAETILYAKKAVALSKETNDISLILSSYSKLAWAYFYHKQYQSAFTTAQNAEASFKLYNQTPNMPLHPSIRGGTYSTFAMMQSKNGESPERALGYVAEIDPGNEIYAFMDFKRSNQLLETGWAYCYYGNQTKAMEALAQRVDPETLSPKIPQSKHGRIETINAMALSTLRSKDRDLEKVIYFWTAGIQGAYVQQREQLFRDALAIYEFMEIVWPDEPRITELRDLTKHW